MNTPLLECNNCNLSEKGSFSILKGYKVNNNNDEKKKEQLLSSSDENNNSTNNLEIIDYPYSLNYNEEETFPVNANDKNVKKSKNDIKNPNILDDGLNNNYLSRNFNVSILNNSSGIINNEDSITQNKLLLKNLYSNYNKEKNNQEHNKNENNDIENNNKENNEKENNNKDENKGKLINTKENNSKNNNNTNNINININLDEDINKCNNNINKANILENNKSKKTNNNIKNKKMYNNEKNNINYEKKKIRNQEVRVEYPFPDSENFITKSNNILAESKCVKTEHFNKKQINKIRINIDKNSKQLSQNKMTNKTGIHSRAKKKLNFNTNLETINPPNTKNISIRCLYSNKSNISEIKENKLFKEKINNTKRNKIKKISRMKTIGRKTTIEPDSTKNQPFCLSVNYQSNNNRSDYLSSPLSKNEQFHGSKINYKKLIYKICKINFNCRNKIANYQDKTIKYNNLMNYRKNRNPNINVTSKTYINPFEKAEQKIFKNLKSVYPIKLKKRIKS